MLEEQAVIHKQVISLTVAMTQDVQSFEVPIDAKLIAIDWDTRDEHGIGFWYRFVPPADDIHGAEVKFWKFVIRGTGYQFPNKLYHLKTVVKNGYAWHILDADGNNIEWAEL